MEGRWHRCCACVIVMIGRAVTDDTKGNYALLPCSMYFFSLPHFLLAISPPQIFFFFIIFKTITIQKHFFFCKTFGHWSPKKEVVPPEPCFFSIAIRCNDYIFLSFLSLTPVYSIGIIFCSSFACREGFCFLSIDVKKEVKGNVVVRRTHTSRTVVFLHFHFPTPRDTSNALCKSAHQKFLSKRRM